MKTQDAFVPGLEGVIAAETAISLLDTEQEKIIIRGYDLIDLSKRKTYADIVYLLLEGTLPSVEERLALEDKLKANYDVPQTVTDVLQSLPKETHPMDGQRTGVSVLAGFDPTIQDRSEEANKKRAYEILGKLPAITVNSYRLITNQKLIEPDQELDYSANFLYMITGNKPTEMEAAIFDRSLLLYSEHEMPNSTFAARVIASTQADMYGALTGAVSSLKGSLHGGANEAVMYMLKEANSVEEFEELLQKKLQHKEKIMGFGHRVYMKKMDPRALMMKESLKQLCELKGDSLLLDMCEAGESVMAEEKGLYPNLDYYAAPVYWMLGIPIPLYTPIFFSSRTAGLCAHITEQHANNRLFRPRVKYTGEGSINDGCYTER
ncbi:citrate synthase [Lentibacillus sp. N15]|uniref:citrate synthase n=1 Tax=Lentibacillus songyuanensis TaxID=3136161 RepID=UPI0031BA559F